MLNFINDMDDNNNHIYLMDKLNIFLNDKFIDIYNDTFNLWYQSYNDNTFPKFMYNFTSLYSIRMSGGRM